MEAISKIKLPELAPQSSDNVSLTKPCGISSSDGMACALLLKQTKDRYINQEIPEATQEMYLAEWEDMVQKYGLSLFRDGLSKAIRASRFFTDPMDVRDQCAGIRRSQYEAEKARKYIREHDAMKAQWEREMSER